MGKYDTGQQYGCMDEPFCETYATRAKPSAAFTEKPVYKPESEFGTSQCGEYKVYSGRIVSRLPMLISTSSFTGRSEVMTRGVWFATIWKFRFVMSK